jgi:thymidylate kinase
MKGKLIVIEGTDCSGKETQSKKLIENLEKNNKKVVFFHQLQ